MTNDSTRPEFWDPRYKLGDMPWDAGGVPKPLEQYLRQTHTIGRVLIPGCGSAYEVKAFADAGWDVLAIDFSVAAVTRAKKLLGDLSHCVRHRDFFKFKSPKGPFDLVYEKNFLCSLPPDFWPRYASRMRELIRPGGSLAGIFFHGCEDEPPPYPITDPQAASLFDTSFVLSDDQPMPEESRWQVWIRKSSRSGDPEYSS